MSILILGLTLLLSACAGGLFGGSTGGGGAGAASVRPTNLFSHKSYTFAPHAIQQISTRSASERIVGNIFANENAIRFLVAQKLGLDNDESLMANLQAPHNFTISYSLADENLASDTNTFLEIQVSEQNQLHAIIRVRDPVEAGLDLSEVIKLVPRFEVEMLIVIQAPSTQMQEIKRRVSVKLVDRAPDFDLNNIFIYDQVPLTENLPRASVPTSQLKLSRSTEFAENNNLADVVSLSKGGNVMKEYALNRYVESDITLFWGLVDASNNSDPCSVGNFYIDNNDLMVKANNLLDYETHPNNHTCRLAISENGVDYMPLAFRVANDVKVTGTRVNELNATNPATNPASTSTTNTGEELITLASDEMSSASHTTRVAEIASSISDNASCLSDVNASCYYAELKISLTGIDEKPIISMSNSAIHLTIAEGVGPLAAYATSTEVVRGGPLSVGNFQHSIEIYDEDEDSHYDRLPVVDVYIVDVSPSHGLDLFSINKNSTLKYQLEVKSSKLDYEVFSPDELTNDKAIYTITLEAVDGTDDGGGPKRQRALVQLEVENVVYRPVFVNPDSTTTTSNLPPLAGVTEPFTIEANIPHSTINGISQLTLLPGAHPFIVNRHRLGTFAAVDPETGNDKDLLYSFVPNNLADVNQKVSPTASLKESLTQREFAKNFALTTNSGNRGKRLIIANVGLTDRDTNPGITLQLVHKQAIQAKSPITNDVLTNDLQSSLSNVLPDSLSKGYLLAEDAVRLVSSNAADPRLTHFIKLKVIDSVTNLQLPGLPHPDTLIFNHEFPLIGFMKEATAGASVIYPGFRDIQDLRGASIENLLGPIIIPAEAQNQGPGSDVPRYGFFPLRGLLTHPTVAADLDNLNLPYIENPESLFDINTATGRISATGNELLFPGPYILLVYITSQADYTAAGSEAELLKRSSDFAVAALSIFMTDVNYPPVLNDFSGLDDNVIKVSIREDQTRPGMELTRFSIVDDNDKSPSGFTANLSAAIVSDNPQLGKVEDLLKLDFVTSGANTDSEELVGIVTLKTRLDYETQNTILSNLRLVISDSGGYHFNNVTGRVEIPVEPLQVKSSEIYINIDLQDVAEAPKVSRAANVSLAGIKETAGSNPAVNIFARSYVQDQLTNISNLFIVENIGDFAVNSNGDRQLEYAVLGEYAGILRVVPGVLPDLILGTGGINTNDAPLTLGLAVADARRLENLGDGRVFIAEVRVKDVLSGLSGTATLPIKIVNDPANSNLVNIQDLLNQLSLTIGEQEVIDRRPFVRGFSLLEKDLIADADEFLSKSSVRERFNLQFEITSQVTNNFDGGLNPQLARVNALEILPEEESFRMRVVDTDLIEKALFGDIEFSLNVTDTLSGNSDIGKGRVTVIADTPKAVTYADSSGDVVNIPVYALSYVQSDYAAQVRADNKKIINTKDIRSAIGFPRGVVADSVINLTIGSIEEYYPTVELEGIELASQANFIERSSRSLLKAENNNVVVQGDSVATQQVIINFAESVHLDDEVDILVEDDRGNLVDARDQFNVYFNLEVVSEPGQEPYLSIRQKTFDYVYENQQASRITGDYNALDSIALFENARRFATLSYFIRAKASSSKDGDAARYALAQFSVALQAFGINQPTQITRIALVPKGESFNHNDSLAFNIFNGLLIRDINENEFAVNSFADATGYDLLVEFNNPDAAQRMELASLISVNIAAAGDEDRDANLISLRLNSTAAAAMTPKPLNGAVELESDSRVSGGPSIRKYFTKDDERYLMRYDFALARNLHGRAMINIKVQDKEPGVILSETTNNFFIRVAPRTELDGPILDVTLGTDETQLTELIEDAGPLDNSPNNLTVHFNYKVTTATGEPLDGQDTALVSLVGVRNYPHNYTSSIGTQNLRHNSLERQFIWKLDNKSISYSNNGWGLQGLDFVMTFSEQLGFANDRRIRLLNITRDIYVAPAVDPTIVLTSSFPAFKSGEFTNEVGSLINQQVFRADAGALVISDADLEYDTLANTLGESITLESSAIANGTKVLFYQQDHPLIQHKSRVSVLTASAFDYYLNLSAPQLDALRATDGGQFHITLSFPNSQKLEDVELQLNSIPSIDFSIDSVNPRIDGRGIFNAELGGYLEVEEQQINEYLTELILTDADLPRLGSKFDGVSTAAGLFRFAPLKVTSSDNEVNDLLQWRGLIPQVEVNSSQASNSILLSRIPQDADVGEYNVMWRFIDTAGFAGTNSFIGNFTLNVTRVEDVPRVNSIAFTNAGNFLNINTAGDYVFPFNLSFTDNDFLEPNQPLVVNASYSHLDFTFNSPTMDGKIVTDGSTAYLCEVGAGPASSSIMLSPLLSNFVVTYPSLTYAGGSGARVNFAGNLHFISQDAGITNSIRPLTFADLVNVNSLGAATPNCNNPFIGTKINAANIHGLTLASPAPRLVGSVAFNSVNYTIQGYRTMKPTAQLTKNSLVMDPNGFSSTSIIVTDTDPDDGIPARPFAPFAVRGVAGSNPWLNSPKFVLHKDGCSGDIRVIVGDYKSKMRDNSSNIYSNQAVAMINVTAVDASGTCILSIYGDEDGQVFESNLSLRFEENPIVSISTNSLPQDFAYEDFIVEALVADGDPDDRKFPKGGYINLDGSINASAFVSLSPTICVVVANGNSSIENYFAIVTPLKPGDCSLTFSATEDAVVSRVSVDLELRQAAPSLELLSVRNEDVIPMDFAVNADRFYAGVDARDFAPPASFIVELLALNLDPGDDDDRANDVGFKHDFVAGDCLVELIVENTNYTMAPDGRISTTASYRISINSQTSSHSPSLMDIGNCGDNNLVFTVSEDNAGADLSIAASKFNFVGVPFINNYLEKRGFFNYTDTIEYQFSVMDGDNTNALTPTLTAVAVDDSICSLSPPTRASIEASIEPMVSANIPHITEYVYDLIIMPIRPGSCMLNLTVMENEYSTSSILTLSLTEAVPRLVINLPSISADFDFSDFRISAEVFDSDAGDNNTPVVSKFVSHSQAVCSVAANHESIANLYTTQVTPLRPGKCSISLSAEEDGVIGVDNITFTLPELAPTLRIVSISNGDAVPISFAAVDDRFYTANDTAFLVEIEARNMDPGDDSSREDDVVFKTDFTLDKCVITLLDSKTNTNYNNSMSATAFYLVNISADAATNVGICGDDDMVFSVREDGVIANLSIAASKFNFEGVPLLGTHSEQVSFSGYRDGLNNSGRVIPLVFNLELIDSDRYDSTDVSISAVRSLTNSVCEVVEGDVTPIKLRDFNVASTLYNASVSVTPLSPGTCHIALLAIDDEYAANYNFTLQLPHLPPEVNIQIIGPVQVPQGNNIRMKLIATKADPGPSGRVTFPTSVTDGESCIANMQAASFSGPPSNPYAEVGHSASVEYVVSSSSVSGDLCGELLFNVIDDGVIGQGRTVANHLRFNGAFFDNYIMLGGESTARQAAGEIIAHSTGNVWFDVNNSLGGCDIYPHGQIVASSVNEGSITKFTLIQNNLTLGRNDCSVPNKFGQDNDVRNTDASVIIKAYSGSLGNTSIKLAENKMTLTEILFNVPAVKLSLYNDSPYYLLTDIIRGVELNGTNRQPLLFDRDGVHIYKHLEPRGWNFGKGDEIIAVVSTPGEGLEPRDLSVFGSWLLRYQTRTSVPYASDSFYVNLTGVLSQPSPSLNRTYDAADLLTGSLTPSPRNDLNFTPWMQRSLTDAGYSKEFLGALSSQAKVDGYLKFTSRQSDLYGDAVTNVPRIHPTFATKDTLLGIITDGLASIPTEHNINSLDPLNPSKVNPPKVKLQTRVCHLTDVHPPLGLSLGTESGIALAAAITREINFNHRVALQGLDLNCYGEEAQLFGDAATRKITTIGGIWQQGENTDLCNAVQGYGDKSGEEVERVNNESCTSFGTLNSENYGRNSYDIVEDISPANPIPWNFQQYIRYRGFSNPDRTSMHYPSIYLIEVYPLSAADPSQILGAPLRVIFQVEPRERSRLQ